MDAAKLPKISADSHIDEPHDLWYEHMDRDLRDRAPRRIRAEKDGGWTLVVDDNPVGWDNKSAEEAEIHEQGRIAAVSHDARLEMLRTDCVNAEIVYPTREIRDGSLQGGMTDGMETSYARMDEVLKSR